MQLFNYLFLLFVIQLLVFDQTITQCKPKKVIIFCSFYPNNPTMTQRNFAILLLFTILFNISLCNLRTLQLQQIDDDKGNTSSEDPPEDSPQDQENTEDIDYSQSLYSEEEQDLQQQQPQDQISQFTTQDLYERPKDYLQELNIGTSSDKYQDQISYDMFVQKYKGNSLNSKDPQALFYRSRVLQSNILRIKVHNSQKDISYILGLNQYADMTIQQFRQRYLSNTTRDIIDKKPEKVVRKNILTNISIDWQCEASPVFQCGYCECAYAAAVVQAIQITMRLHQKAAYSLSVQEIISCGKQIQQIRGCSGGSQKAVYQYIIQKGIGPQNQYKYMSQGGEQLQCESAIIKKKTYLDKKAKLKSYNRVPKGDCAEVVYRLRFRALSVKIDSSLLQQYEKGIIDTENDIELDHTVVLVGYDSEKQAFKIKNTLGSSWGMNGFAWVTSNLGVCQQAYYPVLFKEVALPQECS